MIVFDQQRSNAAMTQAIIGFGRYIITAKAQFGTVQQTRARAASAIVLAKQWMNAGYEAVQILDPIGRPLHPERYRLMIMSGAKPYR